MDIISIINMHNYGDKPKNDIWDDESFYYVGRSGTALLLGNPWSYTGSKKALFHVSTLKEALENYRKWLFDRIIPDISSDETVLEKWELDYTAKFLCLAQEIKSKEIKRIGCWCIEIEKYIPVFDGDEKCHAEILYKGCLLLIEKGFA